MAHDVFISYASADKHCADAACASLEHAGIRCWIAPRDVSAGQEYAEAIVHAISQAYVLVLIFSEHANRSPHVRKEVERAVSKGKPILPLRIEDTPLSPALEYCLGNTQWLDAITPPLEEHLNKLVRAAAVLIKEPYSDRAREDKTPIHALCEALRLGFRASAAEWALMMKDKALSAGQQELAGNCDRMIKVQWVRSRKLFTSLRLDSPTDETNQRAFIERIADDILACGIHEHTAFRVGRVTGAAFFGSVNQTLALAHTKNKIDSEAFDLPLQTLDRITREILNVDPPFHSEVLNPIRKLWSELLTSARQGRSQSTRLNGEWMVRLRRCVRLSFKDEA
ncbi:MAG: toll/interleukin-1 receptor domain-containing protein [Deltaproteobacteria bacterium]|nr:toll/interleukin-1 receptor domain-containing protein [Deltaproteobacteria bacterium]